MSMFYMSSNAKQMVFLVVENTNNEIRYYNAMHIEQKN